MPSDSISEHLAIFHNFSGWHTPRPPSMLRMLVVLCTITHNNCYTMKPDHRLLAMSLQDINIIIIVVIGPGFHISRNIPTPLTCEPF